MEMAFTFDKLWLVNTVLIEGIATYLGIERPMHLNGLQTEHGAERVAERVQNAGGTVYLSGPGAMAYMQENDPHFASKGIEVRWSKHQHTTGDSILTALFDDAEPLATVLKEVDA
jgi:predicted metal-dependent phosphoesterase TrpH